MDSFQQNPADFDFTFLEEGFCARDAVEQRINKLSTSDDKDAFYVGDLGDILNKHLRWVRALPRVTPFYAVKCNDCRPVVMTLATLGTGFDCASKNEIQLVRSLGVDPSRIIYANPCKQISHLKFASAQGVQMMTFDSEEELMKVAHYHEKAKLVLRIATDDSKAVWRMSVKFGATLKNCRLLLERARELSLDIVGVSFHVGSGCTNPDTYSQAISEARCVFNMGAELGYNMTLLDIGGGFPGYDDTKLKFEEFTAVINPALDKYFPADLEVKVIAEPGRYYVSSAYMLAVNIIAKKVVIKEPSACDSLTQLPPTVTDENDGASDSTLMYYVNEGIYGSFLDTVFDCFDSLASPHKKLKPGERTYPCSIWGQTCDGVDRIAEQCILPDLQVGEWLLFHNMGAYSFTMTSTFNGFQKPDVHHVISRSAWQRILQISAWGVHFPVEEASPSNDDKDAFYVGDLGDILKKHLRWVRALPRVTPFYAVKCNDCRPVIMALAALGTGFDCASKNEIQLVRSLGVDPSRIIYANPCKQISHLKFASAQGVQMMTFDSEEELMKVAHYHEKAKLVLRIATDDSKAVWRMSVKFGETLKNCRLLLERARELSLDIVGVSFHVGSGCTNPDTYSQAISEARCVFDMGAELGYNMTLLDIGGGFPGYDDTKLKFEEFTAVINPALDKYFPADLEVKVIAEPGRYYVSSAYMLAVNIIAKKVVMKEPSACDSLTQRPPTVTDENDGASDSTLMYYVNEGIYGSFLDTVFDCFDSLASPHKKLKPGERTYPCSIWGQTCDGLDRIAEQCILPDLQVGEWLLFHNMGAYSFTMTSTFNGFQKPKVHHVISRSAWQRILQISARGVHFPVEEASPSNVPSCGKGWRENLINGHKS